jgi:hypothetical protein
VHRDSQDVVHTGTNTDTRDPEKTHKIISDRIEGQRKIFEVLKKLSQEGDGKSVEEIRGMSDSELKEQLTEAGIPDEIQGMDTVGALRNSNDRRARMEDKVRQGIELQKERDPESPTRDEKLTDEDWKGMEDEIGTHGEVFALNEALMAKDPTGNSLTPDQLGEFGLFNQQLPTKKDQEMPDFAMPRCQHCGNITDGVQIHPQVRQEEEKPR